MKPLGAAQVQLAAEQDYTGASAVWESVSRMSAPDADNTVQAGTDLQPEQASSPAQGALGSVCKKLGGVTRSAEEAVFTGSN
jgi:hypothetical protein